MTARECIQLMHNNLACETTVISTVIETQKANMYTKQDNELIIDKQVLRAIDQQECRIKTNMQVMRANNIQEEKPKACAKDSVRKTIGMMITTKFASLSPFTKA